MKQDRPIEFTSSEITPLVRLPISNSFQELSSNEFLHNLIRMDHQFVRNILNNTPLIIWAADRNGVVTFSEGGCLRKVGLQAGEMVGKCVFEEYPEDIELQPVFQKVLNGESCKRIIALENLVLDFQYMPLYDPDGKVHGLLSIAADITDKTFSEEELRQSEERFSKIFQVNPIAMCITELETGVFVEVNDNFISALKFDRKEILGKSSFDFGFWPDRQDRQTMIDLIKKEGTVREMFVDFTHPHGMRMRTMVSAVQIYFRGEHLLLSCVKDVTNEQQTLEELEKLNENLEARVIARTAELQHAHTSLNEEYKKRNQLYRALQQTEAKWRSLVTNAPDTILTVDREGTILYINHTIASLGIEDIIGSSIYQYMKSKDILKAKQILKEVFQTGIPQVMETEGLNAEGMKTCYSCRVGAMLSGGVILAAMVIATDITQQKQAEQELVRRRAELAHLSRLATMGELAAELSHELNQPLAAINNYTNGCIRRIRSGTTTLEKLIEPLEEMSRQAERASETIKSLRRHVQKGEVEYNPLDLNRVIKNSISLLDHEIQRNHVQLQLDLSSEPLRTLGDAIQLEQVLVNLLLNAIEAMTETPANERKLTIESGTDSEGNLVICVTDTGMGLKKEEEKSIFETFYTTKQKGLGVGLSISQTIIEAHGGKLYPRRNKQGTSFFMTLPATNGDKHRGF